MPTRLADTMARILAHIRRRPAYLSRRLVMLLLSLMTLPWLGFGALAIATSKEMRMRHALDRNQALAQISARLLDRQCNEAFSVLDVLARRTSLVYALRAGDPGGARAHLRDAAELVPDLMLTGAYRANGSLLARYATTEAASGAAITPPPATVRSALAAPYVGRVLRLNDAARTTVLAFAVPVRFARRTEGFLFAYYRLRDIHSWARQLDPGGESVLYILDSQGRVVAASDAAPRLGRVSGFEPLRRARRDSAGAMRAAFPGDDHRPALIGYAQATRPDWSVLVVQPTAEALASTNYLLERLWLLVIPLGLLMLVGAWYLAQFYRGQEEMAELLAGQNEQLSALDKAKSDFLANVSHDLRTPLASLQVSLSGLLDHDVPLAPEQIREHLQMAGEELEHLSTKVRNLLEMSRIEAKAYPMSRHPGDLTDIVAGALERLEPVLRDRRIEADFPPEPLLVDCDIVQIETVVVNLLENAAKYSPAGSPLFLRGQQRRGSIIFTLRDEGPGVPPGAEERVFQKFYRATLDHTVGGTGLGLAICKAIIVAHGGDIRVRNVPGGGAEFGFSLGTLEYVDDELRPILPMQETQR